MNIWKFVFHFLLRKISIIYRGRLNSIISLQIHITLLQQWSTHSQSVSFILSLTSSPFVLLGNTYVWECFEWYAQLIKCRMYEINRTNKHDLISKIFGERGTRKRNRFVWFWLQKRQRTSTDYWWHLHRQKIMCHGWKVLITDEVMWWVYLLNQVSWAYHLCLLSPHMPPHIHHQYI